MPALEKPHQQIVARTVPSTWITRRQTWPEEWQDMRIAKPYRRIVGLVLPNGEEFWAPPESTADRASAYEQRDAAAELLPLDPVKSQRLADFFENFIAKPVKDGEAYNCHTFAAWMQGLPKANLNPRNVDVPALLVGKGRRERRNLKLGELGVVGSKRQELGRPHHSVIGLGEGSAECIQAMWMDGHIGIASYDSIIKFYKRRAGGILRSLQGIKDLGIYTLEAAETAAAA